ncbi:jg13085 [Pararge aegeria aegeria]|uniref:Jg13085 protein n=1 Tax=Pararge aegeria aegeria TaxID=348720 RepID=A0A8S4RKF0_9NEOP|nr:jg13085 [Pararge aegeria aegeria]
MFSSLDANPQDKLIERRQLNDGNWMPTACFGTYTEDLNQMHRVRQSVIDAIEAGYRCIDTAFGYLTEDGRRGDG